MPVELGESLTERELEVVALVAEGLTNREVAEQLYLSHNTIKVHLRNIFTKTGVSSRTELTVMAVQEGWIEVPGVITEDEVEEKESVSPESASVSTPEFSPPSPWPLHRWAGLILGLLLALVIAVLPRHSVSQAAETSGIGADPVPLVIRTETLIESGWEELPPLPIRRARMGITSDGKYIYAVGGITEEGLTNRLDVYNFKESTWQEKSPRPLALANVQAGIVNGKMLVPGGCDDSAYATTHLYDPEDDIWTEVAPLPIPLCAYALTVYQDNAYLFGGWDGMSYRAVAYRYDPVLDSWLELPAPREARGFGAAAVLAEGIFYVGGYDGRREWSTCELYLPDEERWMTCAPLLQPRGGLGLTAIGGRLQAIGGGWSHYLGFNERYDPTNDKWEVIETPIVGEWRNMGTVAVDNALYTVGGYNGDYLYRTYRYEVLPWKVFIPTTIVFP